MSAPGPPIPARYCRPRSDDVAGMDRNTARSSTATPLEKLSLLPDLASQVNQVHFEKVAACPTLCPSSSMTFQIRAFSTRKRRPVDVILTPR